MITLMMTIVAIKEYVRNRLGSFFLPRSLFLLDTKLSSTSLISSVD